MKIVKNRRYIRANLYEYIIKNRNLGQVFTPEHIAELMAEMSVTDENSLKEKVQTNGYITVMDPACGSGRISFSLCKSIK